MDTNVLHYGDNLKVLHSFSDTSINLIYLDPPFNSKATYNVLFKEPTGEPSKAQITAFEDTWHWGTESQYAFDEIMSSVTTPIAVKELMRVLPNFLGNRTDMRAYLVMMCIRLLELKRVLKDTGSIYLHCDTTAGHYLKILMDAIFGGSNFRNEIIWQKIRVTKAQTRGFGDVSDLILFYTKTEDFTFNPQIRGLDPKYIESHYKEDPVSGKLYRTVSMLQKGGGQPKKFGDVVLAPPEGRHWIWSQDRIDQAMKVGLIRFTSKGRPEKIQFYDDIKGDVVDNIWTDIPPINAQARERLPYPTQKPEALLERIILASSNEGDIVLDPFCGCGTALVAAQRLNRRWIGIDITHLAISIMKLRLAKYFPTVVVSVIGDPTDLTGAKNLFEYDHYEFQYWAVDRIGGQPYGDKKKGADTGIDGYLYFQDEKGKFKRAIISVKGGKNVHVDKVRELCHVVDREKAEMGIFISLEKPTSEMKQEASMQTLYKSPLGISYPKIQILTIEEMLNGKMPKMPPRITPVQIATTPKRIDSGKVKML